MTDDQKIADAERIKTFLADEAVKGALARLARDYFEEFKRANSPAEREGAWAKARALDDLGAELQGVIDTGTIAAAQRAKMTPPPAKPRSR